MDHTNFCILILRFKSALIFLFFPFLGITQTISGKIYNDKTTIEDVIITNITQSKSTYSDNEGNFKIEAKINDSIRFTTGFYKIQFLKVKAIHFEDVLVIELKPDLNQLDEVLLSNDLKEKTFDEKKENLELQNLIREDVKNRPYLYESTPSGNADIFAIVGLVASLFKNKKKSKKENLIPIGYNDFKDLFSNSNYFTDSLLVNDLKIPLKDKFQFFDFCSYREIDLKLLSEENTFLLLDELIKSSNAFLELMKKQKEN